MRGYEMVLKENWMNIIGEKCPEFFDDWKEYHKF